MSHLQSLSQIPMDPIFEVSKNFMEDSRTSKANLGIGIYTNREGRPYVFPSVARAAGEVQRDNFNYQSMKGHEGFLRHTGKLFLGEDLYENYADRLVLQQTCGGTGACRLMADLFWENFCERSGMSGGRRPKFLVGGPSWSNHLAIFKKFEIETFDHLTIDNQPNYEAHKDAFERNRGALALLHGGLTHNPTGLNLSLDALKSLVEIANEYDIFLFLDFAYLGFGEGLDADRKYLQEIFEAADNLAVGVSYSKNASLYRHRMGALMVKTSDEKRKNILESQLQQMVRESISNLPLFGAEVMEIVFERYGDDWLGELELARRDVDERRSLLLEKLLGENRERFGYLERTRGMFALLGIDRNQVDFLARERGIYVPFDGRINFAGLRPDQIDFIAEGLLEVC